MQRICIPDWEYRERIKRAAKMVADRGLDVMVVSSTESDYANAREISEAGRRLMKEALDRYETKL